MAEPTGIFIEIDINEANLKKLLNTKFNHDQYKGKLGYYYSKLLHDCIVEKGNVFIFNYQTKTNTCFISYLMNYINSDELDKLKESLKVLSTLKQESITNYAIVSTILPEVIEAYQIKSNQVENIKPNDLPKPVIERLLNTFWSFSENNSFPEPNKALKKRNYLYKNFKNYYKKYLLFIEEQEKPKKIAQATKESPYHLFDKFYSYDHKVYEFRTFTKQTIEIPNADPLTFRDVSGLYADKNYVFLSRLTHNSPPNTNPKTGSGNNPNAIWEFYIVEGVDGESFTYVKEKWDTIYWKDQRSVYIYNQYKRKLIAVENADITTFEYLNFTYGKDQNNIFYLDQVIDINPYKYTLDKYGFIFDNNNIYHFENKLLLDASTFKVLKSERTTNYLFPNFFLSDKNGTYKYNRKWKNEKIKSI